MDGASDWRVFFSIVLPNCNGPMLALFLLQFTWIWNDLLFSIVLGNTPGNPLGDERASGLPGRLCVRRPQHRADGTLSGLPADGPAVPFLLRRHFMAGLSVAT